MEIFVFLPEPPLKNKQLIQTHDIYPGQKTGVWELRARMCDIILLFIFRYRFYILWSHSRDASNNFERDIWSSHWYKITTCKEMKNVEWEDKSLGRGSNRYHYPKYRKDRTSHRHFDQKEISLICYISFSIVFRIFSEDIRLKLFLELMQTEFSIKRMKFCGYFSDS